MSKSKWEVKNINPKWAIREAVKEKLPFIGSEEKREGESYADRFLSVTELRLPSVSTPFRRKF